MRKYPSDGRLKKATSADACDDGMLRGDEENRRGAEPVLCENEPLICANEDLICANEDLICDNEVSCPVIKACEALSGNAGTFARP